MIRDTYKLAQEAIAVSGGNIEQALLLMAERALWFQDQASPGFMRSRAVMAPMQSPAIEPPSITDDWIKVPQTDE